MSPTPPGEGAPGCTGLPGCNQLTALADGRQDSPADGGGGGEQGSVLLPEDASGPLGYSVLEYTFFEQGFIAMVAVAPTARRQGVGVRLLQAAEAACISPKLFTSTNVSNHPMQLLLRRVGWSPVSLLHGRLDDGDPELFYLIPDTQLPCLVEAEG